MVQDPFPPYDAAAGTPTQPAWHEDTPLGYDWMTQSDRLARGRTKYGGVIVRATGGGVAEVGVYNGQDNNSRVYMKYTVPLGETRAFLELKPALFDMGIYIDFAANVHSVCVRHLELTPQ